MKNTKIFQSDENAKIFQSVLVVMGDRPKWFHCNGQPAQMKDFECGEKCEDFKMVSL